MKLHSYYLLAFVLVSVLYFPEILLTPVKKDRLHTPGSTYRSQKDSFQSKGMDWELIQKDLTVQVVLLQAFTLEGCG